MARKMLSGISNKGDRVMSPASKLKRMGVPSSMPKTD